MYKNGDLEFIDSCSYFTGRKPKYHYYSPLYGLVRTGSLLSIN